MDAKEAEYRIRELERKVKGLQAQAAANNARGKATDMRLRDLEIKTAAVQGAPQKDLAKIYDLSRARISQIVKRVA